MKQDRIGAVIKGMKKYIPHKLPGANGVGTAHKSGELQRSGAVPSM